MGLSKSLVLEGYHEIFENKKPQIKDKYIYIDKPINYNSYYNHNNNMKNVRRMEK